MPSLAANPNPVGYVVGCSVVERTKGDAHQQGVGRGYSATGGPPQSSLPAGHRHRRGGRLPPRSRRPHGRQRLLLQPGLDWLFFFFLKWRPAPNPYPKWRRPHPLPLPGTGCLETCGWAAKNGGMDAIGGSAFHRDGCSTKWPTLANPPPPERWLCGPAPTPESSRPPHAQPPGTVAECARA